MMTGFYSNTNMPTEGYNNLFFIFLFDVLSVCISNEAAHRIKVFMGFKTSD